MVSILPRSFAVQEVINEIEVDLKARATIRDRRSRQPATGHIQRDLPPMVDHRRMGQPDLSDHLRPQMQCRAGVGPIRKGKIGPVARAGLIFLAAICRPSDLIASVQPTIELPSPAPSRESNLHGRGPIDLVDGFCQSRVELGIAHRMPEVFDQRPRKARDHAVIGGEAFAGVGARVAAGKRDNPGHALMLRQRLNRDPELPGSSA